MNDIVQSARTLLLALPGISALVGGRVYGFWYPPKPVFPFIIVRAATPGRLQAEAPVMSGISLEVRCYADSEAAAASIDRAVLGQLTGAESSDFKAYMTLILDGGFQYINSQVLGKLLQDPETRWIYTLSEYETEAIATNQGA